MKAAKGKASQHLVNANNRRRNWRNDDVEATALRGIFHNPV
jgi:hypothetical protein